jgi:hypothetical protein
MKFGLEGLRRSFSIFLTILTFVISVGLISPSPAIASADLYFSHAEQIRKTLSDEQLLEKADKFLYASPEKLCSAYLDPDRATWSAIEKSGDAAFIVMRALAAAAAAGAGNLTGYAGIASAVSHLGLGGLTTAVAGFMGSHTAGAAATAVVTSALGGPVVMGTLLVAGTAAAVFGGHKLVQVSAGQIGLGDWAASHCLEIIKMNE